MQTSNLFNTLLDQITEIVVILDKKNNVKEFNLAAENYFKVSKKNIIDRNFVAFCHEKNLPYPILLNDHTKLLKEKISSKKNKADVSNIFSPIIWKMSHPKIENDAYLIILTGKIATEEDKELIINFQNILDNMPGNYWIKDITGRYIACNHSIAKVAGLNSINEIIGRTDYELPWSKYADDLVKNDKQVMVLGTPQIREEVISAKKGKAIILLSIKAPFRDENGNIIGTIGNSFDLSEYKKQTTFTEKRLESIIESIAGNHWWKDVNGVYLGCNDSLAKTLGLNSHLDVIGKTDYQLPWAETADALVQNDQEVMRTGISQRREEQVASKTGETFTFMVVKIPLRDENGNIIGTVGNSIDITEQKKIEKALVAEKERAEQANQAKTRFLATISHELRTPLNGIIGAAEILQNEHVISKCKNFAQDIETSAINLLAIVNEILNFSKLESGKIELKLIPFNLKRIVEEVITNIRHQLQGKDLKLIFKYDPSIPAHLLGDPTRIAQILINLIGNAVKFTEEGYIKVAVKMLKHYKHSCSLYFTVEDTGIGIPENKFGIIFDRFTQVESETYKRRYGGVGLGLAICKQLVTALKGKIGVKSTLGHGSLFWFKLNFQLKNGLKSAKLKKEQVDKKLLFNNRILVVEDEPINQRIITEMLKQLDCQVDVASTGAEALKLVHKNSYDLIFMDIRLTDTNGMLVTREIRKDKNLTPIVALTAHAFEEEIQNFYNAGMNDVLTKPFTQNVLHAILTKWLKSKQRS